MKNLDTIDESRAKFAKRMLDAAKTDNAEEFAGAMTDFANDLQQVIVAEARELTQTSDNNILAQRGVRQLTSEENAYYQKVIDAMKSSNPKQQLTDLDVVMPVTTIDAVFQDLMMDHPLLDAIDFQNTSGLIEYIINTNPNQLATWSPLCAEIVKELTSGFRKIPMALSKLSAFLPVCKAMLDLGPVWLDRYVRTVLSESLYLGLEEGIINGSGINMPIGMNRNIKGSLHPTDGYPVKTTVPVTSLDPVAYGKLLADMAMTENGRPRIVNWVIMIVNPIDYLTKIMPATTIRSADGTFVNNVFPFPTNVVQSIQMPQNRAIIGIPRRYFMGIGTARSGRIEYSDEYRFLEDERVYLVKFYGHGQPLDNTAFVYADITDLKPAILKVEVTDRTTGG